jgi:esterase/lipase superfamily enzyme
MQNHKNFSHTLIPIVWPSIDIPPADERSPIQNAGFYKKEKKVTYQAGKALKAIGDLGTRISLSLMAHSMGNRVFMSYVKHAAVEQRFEAIFLVAADIWEEVFNTRVIENKLPFWNNDNEWADTGLKMCKMLKGGGKIHIFRYKCDVTLTLLSRIMNRRQRLGVHGKSGQEACNRIHEDCKDKLVDVDMARFAKKVQKFHKNCHCYHIMPETITYYNDVMRKG